MSVTLVVPVYENRGNGEAFCLDFLRSELPEVTLIIVDNGSSTAQSLEHLSLLDPDLIRVLKLDNNQGFGGGIKAGLLAARSEWVIWLPGNMKVLPTSLKTFVELTINQGKNSLVKAIRSGRRPIPRVKTYLASIVQTIAAGFWMQDTGGTPSAVNRHGELFNLVLSGPSDYTFDSYVLFKAKSLGVDIVRIPVHYGSRLWGTSHWQTGFRSEVKLMREILSSIIRWRCEIIENKKL